MLGLEGTADPKDMLLSGFSPLPEVLVMLGSVLGRHEEVELLAEEGRA